MAVSSQFVGEIVGYKCESYTSKKTNQLESTHTYYALVRQRPDQVTKIPSECLLAEIREKSQVLGDKLKLGVKVMFWAETRQWRDKMGNNNVSYSYSGVELVQ